MLSGGLPAPAAAVADRGRRSNDNNNNNNNNKCNNDNNNNNSDDTSDDDDNNNDNNNNYIDNNSNTDTIHNGGTIANSSSTPRTCGGRLASRISGSGRRFATDQLNLYGRHLPGSGQHCFSGNVCRQESKAPGSGGKLRLYILETGRGRAPASRQARQRCLRF